MMAETGRAPFKLYDVDPAKIDLTVTNCYAGRLAIPRGFRDFNLYTHRVAWFVHAKGARI